MGTIGYATVIGAVTCLAMTSSPIAFGQDYQARAWAASCASCHGTNGRGGAEIPALAGRPKSDLFAALKAFKAGKRKTATVMHQHAKGYSDAQLERIAEYFSQQSR